MCKARPRKRSQNYKIQLENVRKWAKLEAKASTQGNVEILDKDTALEMEQTESDDIFLLSHKETQYYPGLG